MYIRNIFLVYFWEYLLYYIKVPVRIVHGNLDHPIGKIAVVILNTKWELLMGMQPKYPSV